jgi:uncharacterized phage infection (PIP) family protein YhgE
MTENRIEQIYEMVTQLMHIVSNTNAAVEELREGQTRLESDVAKLKTGQQKLESDVARLEKNQQILLNNQKTLEEKYYDMSSKLDRLETKVDSIIKVQNKQSEILDVLAVRSIRQEAEIKTLKQVK